MAQTPKKPKSPKIVAPNPNYCVPCGKSTTTAYHKGKYCNDCGKEKRSTFAPLPEPKKKGWW